MNELIKISVALLVLSAVFWGIERFSVSKLRQRKWGKEIFVDLAYWFLTPLSKAGGRLLIVIFLLPVILISGTQAVQHAVLQGHGQIGEWPAWFQAIMFILISDFIGYWSHTIFHGEQLWRFHSVHHSSTELNWLSAVRVHPINDILGRLIHAIPVLLLGFSVKTLAIYLPFTTFYAIMLHASVSWSFGPLKWVIASPTFHRWHHSSDIDAQDKNFAGLFPIWDLLFGTFYMPVGRQPEKFGISDNKIPATFFGQLIYPFTSNK